MTLKKPRYTPSPWRVNCIDGRWPGGEPLVRYEIVDAVQSEWHWNERLITAAPLMHKALDSSKRTLETVLPVLQFTSSGAYATIKELIEAIEAALKEAEGRTK
jgi:hypothetical protein